MKKTKFSPLALLTGQCVAATAALGLYCCLTILTFYMDGGSPLDHPVGFPMASLTGAVCAAAACGFGGFYVWLRKRKPSVLWTVVDTVLAIGGMAAYFLLIVSAMR